MKYFLANLGVHTLVLVVLLIFLIITFNRNKRNKVAHSLTYFLPVILSVVIIWDLVTYIVPRYLDLSSIISQNYYSYTGTVEEIGYFNNYLVVDGTSYYINPLRELPKEGTEVRIKYSKNSEYVIEVVTVEQELNEEV